MNTESSIKEYLDSLSQVPGSILWRNRLAWQALAPGLQGDVLSLNADAHPYWSQIPYYIPAMMDFSNITSTYTRTITTAGSDTTFICAFSVLPKAGTGQRYIVTLDNGTAGTRRLQIAIGDSSHATVADAMVFMLRDSLGGTLFFLNAGTAYVDGLIHSVYWSHQGATGDFVLEIDGIQQTGASHPPGTMWSGAQNFNIGTAGWFTPTPYDGQIGYLGYNDSYQENPEDFFSPVNTPLKPDEAGWGQWPAQPQVWNENGDLLKNYGSIGNFTRTGTPFVGKGWIA